MEISCSGPYTFQMTTHQSQSLSIGDAARWLGLSVKGLRRRANGGEIPCQRTQGGQRRFDKRDLDQWVAEGKMRAMTEDHPYMEFPIYKRVTRIDQFLFSVGVHARGCAVMFHDRTWPHRKVSGVQFCTDTVTTALIYSLRMSLHRFSPGDPERETGDLETCMHRFRQAAGALCDATVVVENTPFPSKVSVLLGVGLEGEPVKGSREVSTVVRTLHAPGKGDLLDLCGPTSVKSIQRGDPTGALVVHARRKMRTGELCTAEDTGQPVLALEAVGKAATEPLILEIAATEEMQMFREQQRGQNVTEEVGILVPRSAAFHVFVTGLLGQEDPGLELDRFFGTLTMQSLAETRL